MPFPYPDTVFINGPIYTCGQDRAARAEALAIYQGRIVAVGRMSEIRKLAGPQTAFIDLQGKAVLPGFIDAHMHLTTAGLRQTGFLLDISTAGSLAEVLEQLRETVKTREPGIWVRARGWDDSQWPERRYLTRDDLDRVAPQNPLIALRVDGHLMSINSRALAELSIPRERPEEFDERAGLLREKTAWDVYQQIRPNLAETERALAAGIQLAHTLGVTSLHDVVGLPQIKAYERLRRQGQLNLRVRLNPEIEVLETLSALGLSSNFGDELLKLGAIKLFADGSIGARNAALFEPYADAPSTSGRLNYAQDELDRLVRCAHAAGFQIMIHAIGDRAIEAALEAIAHSRAGSDDRPRIEHFELATPEQIERCRELGVIASMQPNFLQWSGPKRLYAARLGGERDQHIDPHRWVLEQGLRLALGSDGMPFGPLFGIALAVDAAHEGQRLSIEEALRAYTLGAAYAGFAEDETGSLEVGKWADLVVLSEDPYEIAPERFAEIKVLQTYLAGELVFEQQTEKT